MLGIRFLTVWGAVGDTSDVRRDPSEALGNTDVRVFGNGCKECVFVGAAKGSWGHFSGS